jgi:hypothetical protein
LPRIVHPVELLKRAAESLSVAADQLQTWARRFDSPVPISDDGIMASTTTTTTTVTDDLDGSPNAETIHFGFEGTEYELDLSKKNAKALESQLSPYVAAARKSSAPTRRPARHSGQRSSPEELAAIRSWARENRIAIADRGRISKTVVEQYKAAH